MKRKWIYALIAIVIIIAVVGALGWLRRRQQANAASDFQTVAAGKGDLTATVGATGVVRANQSAVLSWQTSGTVGEVNVKTRRSGDCRAGAGIFGDHFTVASGHPRLGGPGERPESPG